MFILKICLENGKRGTSDTWTEASLITTVLCLKIRKEIMAGTSPFCMISSFSSSVLVTPTPLLRHSITNYQVEISRNFNKSWKKKLDSTWENEWLAYSVYRNLGLFWLCSNAHEMVFRSSSRMDQDSRLRPFMCFIMVSLFLGFILPQKNQKCILLCVQDSGHNRLWLHDHM